MEKWSHGFEREQKEIYVKIWREEKEEESGVL